MIEVGTAIKGEKTISITESPDDIRKMIAALDADELAFFVQEVRHAVKILEACLREVRRPIEEMK